MRGMAIYTALCRTPLRRSYLGKLQAAALAGVWLPFAMLVVYTVLAGNDREPAWALLGWALAAAVGGSLLAMWLLRALHEPLRRADRLLTGESAVGELGAGEIMIDDVAGRLLSAARRSAFHGDLLHDHERRALVDPLTGLHNRQWCEMHLAEEITEMGREGEGLGVALLELDDYCGIGERHGGSIADECLCVLARTAQQCMRGGDRIARWAGEQFILVVKGDRANLEVALQRLAKALDANPLALPGGTKVPCGITAGAVVATGPETADALVRSADRSLAKARRLRDGNVVFFGD